MDKRRMMGGRAAPLCAFAAAALALASACSTEDPNTLLTSSSSSVTSSGSGTGATGSGGSGGVDPTTTSTSTGEGGSEVCPKTVLDERFESYTEALRSASFKLVGDAPTLQQMMDVKNAAAPADKYAEIVDLLLADARFKTRMVEFWRSALRMSKSGASPSRDSAPLFAARLLAEGLDFMQLVTADTNTCPTFDAATATFSDGSCSNTMDGKAVGILTDPGVHALYYGNLAFRRNRFFHEAFLCKSALDPVAEPTDMPGAGGPAGYASPWPWNSISGGPGAQIDFLHDTGTICANCHATWNHRAPLYGMFDENGVEQPTFAVHVPAVGVPLAVRTDWLPEGEHTGWKSGMQADTLAELGGQIAGDPEVHACMVGRMWNYAMSRGDIVETGNKISDKVTAPFVTQFESNGHDLRAVFRSILLSADFVRF